jgi:signal transduction histidine kinase
MSKRKPFSNRLTELLGSLEPIQPDPDKARTVQADVPPPAWLPAPDEPASENLQVLEDEKLRENLRLLFGPLAENSDHSLALRGGLGWEDFLNAIDRKDQIGFSFQDDAVEPLGGEAPSQAAQPQAGNGSILQTQLDLGEHCVGTLHLERPASESWSPQEAELLAAVARQVTQHIENLRLISQAEQYRQETEQVTRRLTRQGWEQYLEEVQQTSLGFVYEHNQVLPLNAPLENPEQSNLLVQELSVRDERIGQLVVTRADSRAYSQADKAAGLLTEVASRLTTHIENLRLLEETERSRQQLDKRAAELETVARVSTAAATTLNPQVLLKSVVELTAYSFSLYHAQIFLMDEQGENLVLAAGSGKFGDEMVADRLTIRLDDPVSLVAHVARNRSGEVVDDLREQPAFTNHPLLPEARSEMVVPMVVGTRLLGVFEVMSNTDHRFGEEDRTIYATLAAQVAVALQNARLYAEQLTTVERLRELDQLKSSFMANMSHELRTPLNSIIGFTQVISEGLDGPLTEDMLNDLSLIEKNGKHLLNLINGVLDMAKIESGRLSLYLEPVELEELFQEVLATSASLAREKTLALILENDLPKAMTINLDRTRIRQVLINLIGNAVKFTDSGSIRVHLSQDTEKLLVRIIDSGIGIPSNKLETIFEAFSQVDSSTTRKAGGTGLGLPISRRLVELHGGRLWAESTGVAGEGSVFLMEIPLR